jgi:hypothetical protein
LTFEGNWPVDHELLSAIEGNKTEKDMILSSDPPIRHARKRGIAVELNISLKVKETPACRSPQGAGRLGIKPERLDSNSVSVKLLMLRTCPLSMQLRNSSDQPN